MDFGSLLKTVLTMNDIKMYNLANALGYDKSYISKWVNGAKLPPSKEIDRLADSIGEFVTQECGQAQKGLTAREFGFARKDGTAPEDPVFTAKLAAMFKEAYWQTKYAADEGAYGDADRPAGGEHRGRKRPQILECILVTQPVTKDGAFQSVMDDFRGLDLKNSRIKLKAVIDQERFGEYVDLYWKHICHLLRIGNNAEVELVELGRKSGVEVPDRLLIAKNAFVEQTMELPFSHKPVSLRTSDPSVVDAYYDDARRFLQQQQYMLESSNTNDNLYYYKYAIADQKRYLLHSMFPCYMSEDLFDELLEKYGTKTQRDERARSRYLKEFTIKKSVVIYDSALLRYMSTGKISAFDAYEGETLTKQERRRHLQGLIDELEDGRRLELKILSDRNPILNYDETSMSFFMNADSAYCSDIRKKKEGVRYFVSSDSRKYLGLFLDHIHGLSEEHLTGRQKTIDYIYNGMKNI